MDDILKQLQGDQKEIIEALNKIRSEDEIIKDYISDIEKHLLDSNEEIQERAFNAIAFKTKLTSLQKKMISKTIPKFLKSTETRLQMTALNALEFQTEMIEANAIDISAFLYENNLPCFRYQSAAILDKVELKEPSVVKALEVYMDGEDRKSVV